jgi:hypothetical protein
MLPVAEAVAPAVLEFLEILSEAGTEAQESATPDSAGSMVVVAEAVYTLRAIGQDLAQVEAATEPQMAIPDDQLDQTPVAEAVVKDTHPMHPAEQEALE